MMNSFNSEKPTKSSLVDLTDLPQWVNLSQACQIKGLNYKTSQNRPELQPLRGVPEGYIGGRKCWRRETILEWVPLSDSEILSKEEKENGK